MIQPLHLEEHGFMFRLKTMAAHHKGEMMTTTDHSSFHNDSS